LLGGDDKTAVAVMLEVADYWHAHTDKPAQTIELIFTLGEECGLKGSLALDRQLVHAKEVLVFDWLGSVQRIVTQSPAYYCLDVAYTGKDAHPAEWQHWHSANRRCPQQSLRPRRTQGRTAQLRRAKSGRRSQGH
jgi:di/tripeptidase